MNIRVENKPVTQWHGKGRDQASWREFVLTLKNLEVGQSFLWKMASNDRTAINITGVILDRRFKTAREGAMHRIGRVL